MSGAGLLAGRSVLVTQRVVIDERTDEARDALAHDWAAWLARFGLVTIPVANTLRSPADLIDACAPAAVVLSGGGDIAPGDVSAGSPLHRADPATLEPPVRRDRVESMLLAAAIARGVPVLAVCRGMQFVNRFFGGTLRPHHAAPAGPHARAGERHALILDPAAGPEGLRALPTETIARSYHDHAVLDDNLASELTPIMLAPDGVIEGVVHRRHAVLGVQWHPERQPEHPWSAAVLRAAMGDRP